MKTMPTNRGIKDMAKKFTMNGNTQQFFNMLYLANTIVYDN